MSVRSLVQILAPLYSYSGNSFSICLFHFLQDSFLPSNKNLNQTLIRSFLFLDPGVWYLFKVSVKTNAGWSPEKRLWVEIPPGPPSGPPLEVRASAQSSTRIQVTWQEPDEWKRNGPLAGYSVVYNPLNRRGLALVKNVTNPNQTLIILTDLKMFTEYEIRVRALGIKGPGPLSRPVVVKTNEGSMSVVCLICQYETIWLT